MRFEGKELFVSKAEYHMIQEHEKIQQAFGNLFNDRTQIESYIKANITEEEWEAFDLAPEIHVKIEELTSE